MMCNSSMLKLITQLNDRQHFSLNYIQALVGERVMGFRMSVVGTSAGYRWYCAARNARKGKLRTLHFHGNAREQTIMLYCDNLISVSALRAKCFYCETNYSDTVRLTPLTY